MTEESEKPAKKLASPERKAAQEAFDAGDYRAARTMAERILSSEDASEKAKDTARAILKKTSPPPLAKYIFLMSAVLLLILFVFWMGESRKHVSGDPAPVPTTEPSAKSAP